MNRQKIVQAAAVFFAVMLCFTLLSRAADQAGVVVVTIGHPENRMITHQVTASGRVVQNRELAVTVEADQRVTSVVVSEGERVEKGALLFELDQDLLKEKILAQKQEIQRQELYMADAGSQRQVSAQQRANDQAQAAENYSLSVSRAQVQLARAREELQRARQELKKFQKSSRTEAADSSVEEALEDACEEKTGDYIQACQELYTLQWEIENAVDTALRNAGAGGSAAEEAMRQGAGLCREAMGKTQAAEDEILEEDGTGGKPSDTSEQRPPAEDSSGLILEITAVEADAGAVAAPEGMGPAAVPGDTGPAAVPGDVGSAATPEGMGSAAVPGNTGSSAAPEDTESVVVLGDTGPAAVPGDVESAAVPGDTGTSAAPEDTESVVVLGDTGLAAAPGLGPDGGNGTETGEDGDIIAFLDSADGMDVLPESGTGRTEGDLGSEMTGGDSGSPAGNGAEKAEVSGMSDGTGAAEISGVSGGTDAAGRSGALTQAEQAKLEQSVRDSYAAALTAARQKVEDTEAEKNAAADALAAYQKERLASLDGQDAAAEEQLIARVRAAQNTYQDAAIAANEAEVTGGRAVISAGIPSASDSTVEREEITLEQMELQLEKLEKLKAADGKVYAPADGLVLKVGIAVGEKTTDTTAVLLADLAKGYRFTADITEEQEKQIGVGDLVTLEGSGKTKLEGQAVASLAADEEQEELYHITVQLPEESFEIGANVTLVFTKKSEPYSVCVPLSALHLDQNGQAYVLVPEERDSIMGTETVARKQTVTVLEKNESYAALAEGVISSQDEVILSSDKAIDDGSRVRVSAS